MIKDVEDLTNEEDLYLHGKCDKWAVENFRTGDLIIALVEYDYDIEKCALLHTVLFRNGQYLDVRGEMNTLEDVLDDFDYGDFVDVTFDNVNSFKKFKRILGRVDPDDLGLEY